MRVDGDLLDGGWRWWPHVVVRGAGFPADGIELLRDSELAHRADAALDGAELRQRFAQEYVLAVRRANKQLRDIAAEPAFLTALTWQNHHLIGTGIGSFAAGSTDRRNSKDRQREELIAAYWQRYCVKNDSIGTFGPVGWGRLRPEEPTSRYAPGPGLISHREVFFESWAIDALARALQEEPGMPAWLAPHQQPFIRLAGQTVVPAVGHPVELTEFEALVLSRCDGATAARDLVPDQAEEVFPVLAGMVKRRWIAWQLDLPATPRPELALREFLLSVGDPVLRDGALAKLDRLEASRDKVAAATDPPALLAALSTADTRFTELTDSAPAHNAGRAYGGRTLLYHDSRRDGELTIGRDLLAAARPVGLLAHSARWLCAELATALREPLLTYLRSTGSTDLASFWFRGMQPFLGTLRTALPRDPGRVRPALGRDPATASRRYPADVPLRRTLAAGPGRLRRHGTGLGRRPQRQPGHHGVRA